MHTNKHFVYVHVGQLINARYLEVNHSLSWEATMKYSNNL